MGADGWQLWGRLVFGKSLCWAVLDGLAVQNSPFEDHY